MKRLFPLVLFFVFSISSVFAGEGMWLPLLLKSLNEAEMQSMGMRLSAEDIYSVNQGSLKDAIVHFGGFCTSEVISDNGLLLTNHHCGYGQIRSHSTIEHNYLKDGFWASSHEEELPNPGLTATFIDRMMDVTESVLEGVTDELSEKERQSKIDKNIAKLKNETSLKDYEELVVRPFYYGNEYYAFVTVTYKDVRLVGTPPESIGKFGADTDNWEWPRHTGDFSLFRIYAGPDNLPAEYSEENVPYTPKHSLPISLDGVEEGDFTMVFGFPGRTQEYLPAVAINQILETVNPTRISLRDKSLKIMDSYMRADPVIKIQYASKFARIANGWKKWIGESQGLREKNAILKKNKLEAEVMSKVRFNPQWLEDYGRLIPNFAEKYGELREYRKAHEYTMEVFFRNTEIFRYANRFSGLLKTMENNGVEEWRKEREEQMQDLLDFHKDYSAKIDREIAAALVMEYIENVEARFLPASLSQGMVEKEAIETWLEVLFDESHLTTQAGVDSLLQAGPEEFKKIISEDDIVTFTEEVRAHYGKTVSPEKSRLENDINLLQRTYMKALREMFPDKRFYPDANSTMRVSYGKVQGYSPRDAVQYEPQTYLEGVMEKYVPGDYEFDVDQKLRDLYAEKDYGPYAEDGKMPVCFLGSNHTTGGNSGSPVIDAHGNLIGLNFDRTWEGTMSDLNYDVSICRNIMVDMRYVLFIMDKYAGATHLIEELELTHPKKEVMPVPDKKTEHKPIPGKKLEKFKRSRGR